MRKFVAALLAGMVLSLIFCTESSAQFKSEAFQQQYNNDKSTGKDSVDVLFSFKDYFGGLAHKNEIKIGTMAAGSAIFVGGDQIYNKDYWKLPLVYGGILGPLGAGIWLNTHGNQNAAKYCFIGSGVAYWATVLDGVASYKAEYPLAGKATIYSLLLPGLGQAYNHEFWKIPIYVGGMGCAVYFYTTNNTNYQRYRRIYQEATSTETEYTGPITSETALYYRDTYRRLRDYSILAIAAVYLLQVIDANVFSYMHDFEIVDDLAVSVSPTVIVPENQFAYSPSSATNALGVRFGFTF